MKLASSDLLVLFLYLLAVVGVGLAFRAGIKSAADFFRARRGVPAWLGILAVLGASVGVPEVIGMGAAGARYGLYAAQFFGLGAVIAMLLSGLVMMPLYYGSKARTVPEFLGLRFDGKTRVLAGSLFAAMTVLSIGVSLAVMARTARATHVFDSLFRAYGMQPETVVTFTIALSAVVVAGYVALGGLTATVYNQAVQFALLVAGLFPVVWIGLSKIGGWSGLKASLPASFAHQWAGTDGVGVQMACLALLLGAAYWCADFRVLQIAMAAKDADAARRIPLLAAIPRMILPVLIVVPGMIAIGMPTPRTHTVERVENGAIIHETTVVRPEVEAGRGLVPARVDLATGKPAATGAGQPVLDYEMATPNALAHFLPSGLLGLGLAALLACLMSGMAANLMAFSAVFTCDIYEPFKGRELSDRHAVWTGRLAALAAMALSIAAALVVAHIRDALSVLLLVFSVVAVPIFAVVVLGVFWKRATGQGAFAGLIAGVAAAILHHGLTAPAGSPARLDGAWLFALYQYPSSLSQALGTAVAALAACLVGTAAVSLVSAPRAESELAGLVCSLAPAARRDRTGWKRTKRLACAVLLAGIVLSIVLG